MDRQGATLMTLFSPISSLGIVATELLLPEGIRPGRYTVVVAWGDVRSGADLVQTTDQPFDGVGIGWQQVPYRL